MGQKMKEVEHVNFTEICENLMERLVREAERRTGFPPPQNMAERRADVFAG